MCGRFSLISDIERLGAYYRLSNPEQYLGPAYNIAPSQDVAAVVLVNGERRLAYFRWGLIPSWAKERSSRYAMINARVETVHAKPSFRSAFRHRRCIIPADGFYEWQGETGNKQAWRIEPETKHELLSFAGLWEIWEKSGEVIRSCTIIVGDANAQLKSIHDRMPVLLPRAALGEWLDPRSNVDSLRALLDSPSDEALRVFKVSAHVNDPRNNDVACTLPQS